MEPMVGMLSGKDEGTGAMNTMDLRDPRVQAAAARLREKGLPINRVSLAEELATMPALAAPQPAAPIMPVRGGPSSSFQDPYEARLAAERAQKEAEFRAAQAAARAKRQPGMITGR